MFVSECEQQPGKPFILPPSGLELEQEQEVMVGFKCLITVLIFASLLSCAKSDSESLAYFDFTNGGKIQTSGLNPNFTFFSAGPFVGNDGTQTSEVNYLEVGSNPFHLTTPPAAGGDPLDHVKFLAFTSASYPLSAGKTVSCSTRVSARQFIPQNPFGVFAPFPASDVRFAAGSLTTLGDTFASADIWVSNTTIYALYERLPFGRTANNVYAAYTHLIPLATRSPNDWNTLTIAYSISASAPFTKSITWTVDGDPEKSYTVSTVGYLINPRTFLVRDEGGVGEDAFPNSVQCALGTFDLLDAYPPCNQPIARSLAFLPCLRTSPIFEALVDLSNGTSPLYNPQVGSPIQATFFDPHSLQSNRLFGQGAVLDVEYLAVSTSTP